MADQPNATGPGSSDQWRDVMKGFDEFGDAVARWVKAAVNDPRNRERAEELKVHVTAVAEKVSDAVSDAGHTSAGESVRSAAGQAGDAFKQAGDKFTTEVAPSLADMFKSAAAGLSEAASRMETRTGAVDAEGATGSDTADAGGAGPAQAPEPPDATAE